MAWWNPIDWIAALGATITDPAERALACYDRYEKQRVKDVIERDRLLDKLEREKKAARDHR